MFISILLLTVAPLQQADTIRMSLGDAVDRGLRANPSLRAARADARAAAQDPLTATRAFLPTVHIDAQGMRTTDPVAVFGLKLRQENFASEDLSLEALNRPDPYTGYSTSATIQIPLLAPEGLFGYAATRRAAGAQRAAARRAAGGTAFQISRAYWDAQLAARQVAALATVHAAALAHADQAEALLAQGLVTGLDARLARVRAADIDAQRIGAAAEAENAQAHLRVLLGLLPSDPIVLTDDLEHAPTPVCDVPGTDCSIGDRGDVLATELGAAAASLNVRSAWASQFPSLAVFGSFARYSRTSPWGDGSGDWTVGVGVSWRPFQALAGVGAVRRAKAEQQAALARAEAAERQAQLEVDNATRMVEAARARVGVATDADTEAIQALNQARIRYRTGAAPITELLDVEAAATAATLNLLSARRDLFVAQAALDFALGANDR